jgi:tryptophan 2,3-dioxygenase
MTSRSTPPEVQTYSSYLRIEELLDLQTPRSGGDGVPPEHDETLFIVIHQVYELWFKQVLHELTLLQSSLEAGDTATVLAALKRVLTILKTLVSQIDVLETMTPVSFNSFRTRLDSASGFQSAQFREVEFVLGHRRQGMVEHMPEGSKARARLAELMESPSVYDSFLRYLATRDHEIPPDLLERDAYDSVVEDERVQDVLIHVYHHDFAARQVCERLVDLDEGLQEWRYRHVKMVERTIGFKEGTGGSAGSAYLRTTLFKPLFPDLWTIRARL